MLQLRKMVFFRKGWGRVEELVSQTTWSREINIPNILKHHLERSTSGSIKESTCQCREIRVLIPGLWRLGNGNPLQWCLPETHGQGNLVGGYSPWGTRIRHNSTYAFIFLHLENFHAFYMHMAEVKSKKRWYDKNNRSYLMYMYVQQKPLAPNLLFLELEDTYEDTLSTKKDHTQINASKIKIILKIPLKYPF